MRALRKTLYSDALLRVPVFSDISLVHQILIVNLSQILTRIRVALKLIGPFRNRTQRLPRWVWLWCDAE